MECQKCGKRFNFASNIKDYNVICPYCKTQHKVNFGVSRTKVRFNTRGDKK